MPDRPGLRQFPPAFFDPRVSDAQLQELWTAGAETTLDNLKRRRAELMEELSAVNEAIAKAEEFVTNAQAVRERYRRPRKAPLLTKPGSVP